MRRSLFAWIVFLLVFLPACEPQPLPDSTPAGIIVTVPAEYVGKKNPLGPEAAAAGEKIFQTNCVPCHGEKGRGDGPAGAALVPHPANLAVLNQTAADDYLFWRINTGVPGTAMVAWKGALSEDDIWQVIAFIRTLR